MEYKNDFTNTAKYINYREVSANVFDFVPDGHTIHAHCISGDFALGKGIAMQFRDFGVKDALENMYKSTKKSVMENGIPRGFCLYTGTPFPGSKHELVTANLITKTRCYNKPTLKTLEDALADMIYKSWQYALPPTKFVMPKIGCGLDQLNWADVRPLIQNTFKKMEWCMNDTERQYEVIVCVLR